MMNDFQTPLPRGIGANVNAVESNSHQHQHHDQHHDQEQFVDSDSRYSTPQPLFLEARQPQQPKKKSKTVASSNSINIVNTNIDDNVDVSVPPDAINSIFAALFENDGVLGMAVLDEHSHRIHLQQFSGTARHSDVLVALDAFESLTNIVLPSTAVDSALYDTLLAKHGNTVIATMATRSMNTVRGRNLLLKYALEDGDDAVASLDLEQANVALGAAAALFDFVDSVRDVTLDQHSLRVEMQTQSAHKMRIDAATAAALELVANVVDGSKRATLLGLFSTRTPAGERLLRRELLAPPSDAAEIELRATAVAELLEREVCYSDLDTLSRKFIDFARTLRHFSHTPKQKNAKANEKHIRACIAIKHQLLLFTPLANLLATCRSPLLQTISRTLAHGAFRDLLADIDTILARDTALSRNAQKMRTEIVFAVQSGVNGLLDVARKSYTETEEDMNALLASYQARFGMPTMQLQFVAGRGYHLSLPPPPASTELPPEFVQVQRQAKRWRCSTEALLSLNQRNAESLQEILIITERLLAELVARVGARLAPLLAANDALTQLDMLMAFAALVTKARTPYCKPTISPVLAPIAIKQGRHPVFEQLASTRERGGFVANDLIVGADGRNVLVITGTNMSGKSTLLRQTALIVVLAHIGCFVPADHCTVRVIERLCVRIGDDGAIKSDASSFFVECREVASALAAVSPRALLLIDELGRSTESSVGVALSWSVAEHIALQMRALTLYVTHFSELHRLETLYGDSVRVMHMQVDQMGEHMTARFQLAAGGNARESYGIDVAAQAGFPESLVQEARVIRATLDQHALENKARSAQILEARTAIERTEDALAKRLLALRHSTLSAAPLRAYLNSLATEFQSVMIQQ